MRLVPRERIEIRERQRKSRTPAAIGDLKTSILSKGLLHPPVVWQDGDKWVLLAGETRLLALDAIHADGLFYLCNGSPITPGEAAVTVVTDLTPAELFEAEFEENEFRQPLSWQDRALALAKLHELKSASKPYTPTFRETALELTAEAPDGKVSGVSAEKLRTRLRESTVIAAHLSDPKVANARNHNEALAYILKKENTELQAVLASRGAKVEAEIAVKQGDLLVELPLLEANQFDLILADPPYGITANNAGLRGRTVVHHDYEDTPQVAEEILRCIVQEGFRVTKPRANLFIFGDIDWFGEFKVLCKQMGWVPFRTPLIWQKSHSEGLAPWGASGPRRTYECIFYATKGQKGLLQSPTDILDYKRVARNEREHGAEKPIDLLKALLEVSTLPQDFVLDPCCGSGSLLSACRLLHRRALGIEKDPDYYKLALVRSQRSEEGEQMELIA